MAQEPAARFDWAQAQPHWVKPIEPFRIIGDLYYVGTEGLAVYLVAGERGHALIDGGLAGHEQTIIDNIAALGFSINDVKYLLNTHAHFDHSGGLATLKEVSGAELYASAGDRSALEGGTYLGFESRTAFKAPPVEADLYFFDDADRGNNPKSSLQGVVISFGDSATLRSEDTPGHSRGCTSWRLEVEEAGANYDVLIFCSATVAANRLIPPQYPGIVDDYRLTFEKTRDWNPDIFLANHPEVFFMKETREKQKTGDALAFVNRGAFQKYIAAKERAFDTALETQMREASDAN